MKKEYNSLILKALNYFIENPYIEVYLREFSRINNLNLNTSQRFLEIFLKQGFIKEQRKANLRIFKANIDNIVFRHIKITFILKKIKDTGILENLNDFSSVVLFGSCAKGLDDKNSDIDIVLIGNKKINFYEYEKKLGKQINPHFFNFNEWRKEKDNNKAFYQDVISTGINLIGEIPILD